MLFRSIAIAMMHGKQSGARQTEEEAHDMEEREVIAIVPLSTPLMVWPSAISSMILSAQQHPTFAGHLMLAVPALIVALSAWLTLQLADNIIDFWALLASTSSRA